ncbi:hypothetical protein DH2020_023496 [Rehmannia glutinosa]|uniref:GH10 domain-containing protein n=1 Tax=Rehmannia glutinosa TaxID=99300 RepID=A0ABR0W8K6_REHGL
MGLTSPTNSNLGASSAWLQVSHGNADIAAIFKTNTSYETAGWVVAQKGCWSMLKGGLVSKNSGADIWADSISLQPFTHEEWKSHQDESIEKVRKTRVKFQAVDQHGQPIPNATISIINKRPNFPLGVAINKNILGNNAYQNWFTSRFKLTVFENELKWVSDEVNRGAENYSIPDALLQFAKRNGVLVRGHNVIWDDPKYQPYWVYGLSPNDLRAVATHRTNAVVLRYRGQLIHWDVVNENLHWNFYESRLGDNASTFFYQRARYIDRKMLPFLNEYNTIEEPGDGASSPAKYMQKIQLLRSQGYKGPLGIGLQGHFGIPNLPYVRSSIDFLASAGLPIWITELDVKPNPNQVLALILKKHVFFIFGQAAYLEQILRELHAHKAVRGILLWVAWSPQGCYTMCLTDNNFKNLATGDVVDKIRNEWSSAADLPGTTDSNGFFQTSLFHGEYEAKISHPKEINFLLTKRLISYQKRKHEMCIVSRLTYKLAGDRKLVLQDRWSEFDLI